MSANSHNVNYFSGFANVSFDGFINENNFELNSKETNLVENLEIYHGIAKNPLSFKKDIFLGFLIKSKYDGIGGRMPIDLSVALDISGSMQTYDSAKISSKCRLELAKEGFKKLVSILDEKNDRVSLLTFNHEINKIFSLYHKEDIYNLVKKCVEEKNISITFMAIGSESNLSLADKLCDFKGCNYFSITNPEELENYLTTNFKNIFFPVAHYTKIRVKCSNKDVKINKCIGGSEPELQTNAKNETFFNIGSCFPSEIITINDNEQDKNYVRGGIVLLNIEINSEDKLNFEFNLEYETFKGEKSSQNYVYEIPKEQLNINYFSNNNIQKGISIYYFTEVLNTFVKKYNKYQYKFDHDIFYVPNKNEEEEDEKKKEIEFIENAQSVRDYLKNNFVYNEKDLESKKNLDKYLKLINERYTTYNNKICKFYKIYPVINLW